MDTNITLLSWSAPAKPTYVRSRKWYVGAGVFAAACGIVSIIVGAWSATIVTILVCGVYWLVHRTPHPKLQISITEGGVQLEKRFAGWNDVTGFWILQGPGYHELHIGRRDTSDFVIQLDERDPQTVIDLLKQFTPYLPEKKEKFIDAIIRLCQI